MSNFLTELWRLFLAAKAELDAQIERFVAWGEEHRVRDID